LEEFGEVVFSKLFLEQIEHNIFVLGEMVQIDQSISISSLGLVDPQSNQLIGFLELSRLGQQQALEYIRKMSDIKLIVEVNGSLSEGDYNGLMQL